jgi:hypothetical protein
MDRRHFFGALATALAVPAVPRRVYSFLWDEPLVTPATIEETYRWTQAQIRKRSSGAYLLTGQVRSKDNGVWFVRNGIWSRQP